MDICHHKSIYIQPTGPWHTVKLLGDDYIYIHVYGAFHINLDMYVLMIFKLVFIGLLLFHIGRQVFQILKSIQFF